MFDINQSLWGGIMRKKMLNNFGATSIEYGVLASAIALTALTGITLLSPNLNNIFCKVDSYLSDDTTMCSLSGLANGVGAKSNVISSGPASGVNAYFVDKSLGGQAQPAPLNVATRTSAYTKNILNALNALNSQDPIVGIYGLYATQPMDGTNVNTANELSGLSSEDQAAYTSDNNLVLEDTDNGDAAAATSAQKDGLSILTKDENQISTPYTGSYSLISNMSDMNNYMNSNNSDVLGTSFQSALATTIQTANNYENNSNAVLSTGFSLPTFQVKTQSGATYSYYDHSTTTNGGQEYGYMQNDDTGNIISQKNIN